MIRPKIECKVIAIHLGCKSKYCITILYRKLRNTTVILKAIIYNFDGNNNQVVSYKRVKK